nr:MAG TPA: hypothetical protein [Caudoviricetes sp.]
MYCKKIAISVKGRRRLRLRKELVEILFIRRDCNTSNGNTGGFAIPLYRRVKIQSELAK